MRPQFSRSVCGLLIILSAMLAACTSDSKEAAISMQSGWVRAMPPGMDMTAAYGDFINHLDHPIEIHTFGSDEFVDISLHRTEIQAGVSKMIPMSKLVLQPGQVLSMKPGGLHMMLKNPRKDMQAGEQMTLRFVSSEGQSFVFHLPVEAR